MIAYTANEHIESIKESVRKGIIPLHEYGAADYIAAGLVSREFVEFFLNNPYGKTDKYVWETHFSDSLKNLYIRNI